MIVTIDTEKNQIIVNGRPLDLEEKSSCELADAMMKHQGEHEYEGIVSDIQRWYYGYVSKTAWCATCISYFMNKLGMLKAIGGKNENVYSMLQACENAALSGYGTVYGRKNLPETIKKNDIVFLLWNDVVMKFNSSKHVTVAADDCNGKSVPCIGGNQNDSLCIKTYNRSDVYAVYRLK